MNRDAKTRQQRKARYTRTKPAARSAWEYAGRPVRWAPGGYTYVARTSSPGRLSVTGSRLVVQLLARRRATPPPARRVGTPHDAYRARIQTLHGHAESDEIDVQPGSEQDFWGFIHALPESPKAEIVLMDNGNFRAIWEYGLKNRVAIQFLGARRGEYVIFKRRPDASDVSRVAGIDTLDGIRRQIQAFDLMPATGA